MQDPQQAGLEVGAAAVGVDQPRLAAQRDRHRVDREVAAGEVGLDRLGRARPRGSAPGLRVGLGAGGGDVDLVAVEARPWRCAKRSCSTASAPSARGERRGVALDDEVEVGAPAAEQQVAHGAADQVDGLARRRRGRRPAPGRRARSASARFSIGFSGVGIGPFPTMIASPDGRAADSEDGPARRSARGARSPAAASSSVAPGGGA